MRKPISNKLSSILFEIEDVLKTNVNDNEVEIFENFIVNSQKQLSCKIVGLGAGRVGMAVKAFCMRLGHFGFDSWFIGDTTVPHIGKNDILIVASGSGETKTIALLTEIALKNGATILCITGNRESTIAKLAHHIVEVKVPSGTKPLNFIFSNQPMTTLNEQCLLLLFDAITLNLMERLSETTQAMWSRHSNLE